MTFKERLQSLKGKQIIIKKSVLFPVLLLIVLIIIGFALTKSDDDSAETGNRDQDVVVEQSPDQSPPSRDIVDNGSVAGNNTGNGSGQSSNETDPGKVLGTQNHDHFCTNETADDGARNNRFPEALAQPLDIDVEHHNDEQE